MEVEPKNEEFARRVVANLATYVAYIDSERRLRFANDNWLRCFGIAAESVGRPLAELVDPALMVAWGPSIDRALGGEVAESVGEMVDASGTPRVFRIARRPDWQNGVVAGYFVEATDVSALHERELRLQEANTALQIAEEFSRSVADVLPIRISYWDRDLRCQFVNRAYCEWHGRSRESMLGSDQRALFGDSDIDERLRHLHIALDGYAISFEHRNTSAAGQVGVFEVHLTPDRSGSGEVLGVLATSVDVTSERRAQAALTATNAELVVARDRAEAGARAKSAFLANMSHEIRTPMNAIIGMTHLLRRASREPESQRRLDQVSGAAQHLLRLIDDILDLSKVEAGKLLIESVPFAPAETVSRCCGLVSDALQAKGLRLTVDTRDLPPSVIGDAARVSQALINLLANAVKFTERGAVAVTASAREDAHGIELRFEVRDDGIGIDSERLPRLFTAFEQADSTTTRRFGGTGLGLALTQKLVRMMGGDAGASSKLGVGSTFWFTVRVQRAAAAPAEVRTAAAAPALSAEEQLRTRHRGTRILLVEDNVINQEVARSLLETVGLAVDVADDGEQAIEMVSCAAYALVLMDMQMPRVDGLQATRAIREIPGLSHLPIVAMTANAFAEDRVDAMEAGMDDHLSKPVMPALLYATVARWLDRTRPADQATGR